MTVTAIVKQKRKARYDLYVGGELVGTVSEDTLYSNHIKVGMELDASTLHQILTAGEKQDAVNYLTDILSSRAYTVKQAKNKLKEKGFSPEAIAFGIQKMQSYGYIDDETYARDFIENYKATRSIGRLRQDLRSRGISDSISEPLLHDGNETDACMTSLKRKARNKEWTPEFKQKLIRSLMGQGFAYETVRSCISRYEHPTDDE